LGFVVTVDVVIVNLTIIWANRTMIRPTTEYTKVFLALAMLDASPPEVTYLAPATIIIITAITPTIALIILTTRLIISLTETPLVVHAPDAEVPLMPEHASVLELSNRAACVVAGMHIPLSTMSARVTIG